MPTPIMSIAGNIINRFETLRTESAEMLKQSAEAGIVDKAITVIGDTSQFHGPKSVFQEKRSIIVYETFMDYLWAVGYFFLILQEEINKRELDETWNGELFINTPLLQNAFTLFDWALSLSQGFNPWPLHLPNPIDHSRVTQEEKEFCGHANAIFTFAMAYLLYHEFAHLSCHHDQIAVLYSEGQHRTLSEEENSIIRSAESEADLFALEMLHKVDDKEDFKINASLGVITAVISMLFAERSVQSLQKERHPDTDERIKRAVDFFQFEERKHSDYMYHLACNACLLFFRKNGVPWNDYQFDTIEEYFAKILSVFDRYKSDRGLTAGAS
jgi:hypothetical protein